MASRSNMIELLWQQKELMLEIAATTVMTLISVSYVA